MILSQILRSGRAVLFLVLAAALSALAATFGGLAYAVLTESNVGVFHDLVTAAQWFSFVSTAAGLAAVATAAWEATVGRGWQTGAELFGAVLASLLVVIGILVVAANSPGGSDGGSIVAAVGIGGWAVLCVVAAGRRSIAEQAGAPGRSSDLWLIAAAALTLLAVAVGLPSPTGSGRALPIAGSILFLLGFAGLAFSLQQAFWRRHIVSPRLLVLNAGLAGLALSHLAAAIGDGFAFGPSPSLTSVRVGLAVPAFLGAIAWVVVGSAAFRRFADLEVLADAAFGPYAGPAAEPAPGPGPAFGPGPVTAPGPGPAFGPGPVTAPGPGPAFGPGTATAPPAGAVWSPSQPTPPPQPGPPPQPASAPGGGPPPQAWPPQPPARRGWTLRRPRRESPTVPMPASPPAAPPPPGEAATTDPTGRLCTCGAEVPPDAAFCPRCGQPLAGQSSD